MMAVRKPNKQKAKNMKIRKFSIGEKSYTITRSEKTITVYAYGKDGSYVTVKKEEFPFVSKAKAFMQHPTIWLVT